MRCESCIGSHFKCHQNANYGSSMVKDSKNHTVSNPTIGYGFHTIKYANGKSREFFPNWCEQETKTGILCLYSFGLKDKKYLAKTYGKKLGKGERDRILHSV